MSWGFNSPGTSQDAAKTIACCLVGVVKINTFVCNGRYIGKWGVHMNPAIYADRGYENTIVYPDKVTRFETLDDRLYEMLLQEQRGGMNNPAPACCNMTLPVIVPTGESGQASLDPALFLTAVYRGLLGRDPDSDGRSWYTASLEQGAPPDEIVSTILQSPEFRARSAGLFPPPNIPGPTTQPPPKKSSTRPSGKRNQPSASVEHRRNTNSSPART